MNNKKIAFFKIIIIFFILLNIILYTKKFYIINNEISLSGLNLSNEFNKIYSTLYYEIIKGIIKPFYNYNYTIKNYSNKKSKGLCLCTIGKNENLYVKEFVEYYKQLGFDKIVIFDNNNIDDEKLENVLRDYVNNNFVKIIDIRGLKSVQIAAFNFCYQKYNYLYDWIAFFDFDEYLFINESNKIKDYIYKEEFQKCQSILFNWYFYDDNDLEKYENKSILERFNHLKQKTLRAKSMVRGNINNLLIPSTHIIGININYFCNSNGIRVFPKTFYDIDYPKNNKAFIKHFYTKTVEEFCNKILKGDAQFHKDQPNYTSIINNKLSLFFSINKVTKKKKKILKSCLNKHLNNYNFYPVQNYKKK